MRTWSLSSTEPRVGLAGEIGGRDHDLEFALEAVADSFGDLHHHNLRFVPLCTASKVARVDGQAVGSGDVPGVVRAEGLEPPRLASREPKSRASTSSATPARRLCAAPPGGRAARLISWACRARHHKNRPAGPAFEAVTARRRGRRTAADRPCGSASGRSSAIRPGPGLAAGLAMQPDGGAGRLERRHALRQQARDEARQHVAGARGGEPGRRIFGDRSAAVRRGHHRIGALQQHDRAGGRRRGLARSHFDDISDASCDVSEQTREFAFVRGQHGRRRPRALIAANSVSGVVGKARERIGVEHHRALARRAPPAPARASAAPTPPPGPSTTALSRAIGQELRKLAGAIDRPHHDREVAAALTASASRGLSDRDEPRPGPQRAARREPRRAGVRLIARHHHGMAARVFVAAGLRHRKALGPERRRIGEDAAAGCVSSTRVRNADVGDLDRPAMQPPRQQQMAGLAAEERHGLASPAPPRPSPRRWCR